jgi:hypothetical protein
MMVLTKGIKMQNAYQAPTCPIKINISQTAHDLMRAAIPGPRYMGRFITELIIDHFRREEAAKHGHLSGKGLQ